MLFWLLLQSDTGYICLYSVRHIPMITIGVKGPCETPYSVIPHFGITKHLLSGPELLWMMTHIHTTLTLHPYIYKQQYLIFKYCTSGNIHARFNFMIFMLCFTFCSKGKMAYSFLVALFTTVVLILFFF